MSLSPELLSFTILLSLLAGIGAGRVLLRERADLPWAAGWAVAMVGAICMMNAETWSILGPVGKLAGSIHPVLFVAGACIYARRPRIPGLLLLGMGIGGVRALLWIGGQASWSTGLALAMNPAMLLLAGVIVQRHAVRAGEPLLHRLLPIGFLIFAGLTVVDGLFQLGFGNREALWSVWIVFGALFAILQIAATVERAGREREGALRELGDNERRFAEISEGIYDLIFEFDADGRLVYASPGGEGALGFRPGEALGRDGRDLVHPEDLSVVERRIEELEHTPRIRVPPIRVQHADGGWRWLECTLRRYWRENGHERTLLVCRDVTERREADEALEAARERLQAVLSSLGPLRVVVFDERGRVQSIFGPPPAFDEDRYGMQRAEAGRLSIEDFLPEEAARDVLDVIRRVFKTGERSFVTRNVELPNGTFSFRGSFHPLRNREGEVVGALSVTEDVTAEVAQSEEERHRAARAERARRQESLARLAGGLAHEFNNLLMAIGGNADLALARVPEDDPVRPLIREIREAGDAASRLTGELLGYLGQTTVPREELDLSELVAASEPSLRAELPEPVRLVLSRGPAPCPVRADRGALLRALDRLVARAAAGLGDGGTIELRTGVSNLDHGRLLRSLTSEALPGGSYAFLEVRDDGPTIPFDRVDRLFDPFFDTSVSGRAIGLAEVQGIIRAHRGTLEVESGPERGATVRILLPCRDGPGGTRRR